ncbi:MAG: hypothetical protein ACRED2_04970 [Methylocella sp.]
MRILTEIECRELVKAVGLQPKQLENKQWPVLPGKSQFLIRLDGHRPPASTAMARRLAGWLSRTKTCLVWMTEWGIFPSNEDWPLLRKLRQKAGDERGLQEAPGQVFGADENGELASFLDLVIRSGWGGHILAVRASVYMFISHDEFVHVECRSGTDRGRIRSDLKRSSLRYQEA